MPHPTTQSVARGCLGALALLWSFAAIPAGAIMGDETPQATSTDADYAAGVIAFDQGDWQGVIDNMTRVVVRRPWHDNAHSLMGFAYRKLGDYDRSLQFYGKALELNPYNRGALEYLGEAYLEMGQPEQARVTLDRLEAECKRIVVDLSEADWQTGCEEWQELKEIYEAYLAAAPAAEGQAAAD